MLSWFERISVAVLLIAVAIWAPTVSEFFKEKHRFNIEAQEKQKEIEEELQQVTRGLKTIQKRLDDTRTD